MIRIKPITLPCLEDCRLPIWEDARLKDNFKAYFKTSDAQYVWYKGRTWRVKITKVYVYAQCYAAIMTVFTQIKPYPRVVGIDIGGFTTDYLTIGAWHD